MFKWLFRGNKPIKATAEFINDVEIENGKTVTIRQTYDINSFEPGEIERVTKLAQENIDGLVIVKEKSEFSGT